MLTKGQLDDVELRGLANLDQWVPLGIENGDDANAAVEELRRDLHRKGYDVSRPRLTRQGVKVKIFVT
jgi:hypothetical protein